MPCDLFKVDQHYCKDSLLKDDGIYLVQLWVPQ